MTLKFSGFRAIVKVQVHAKFKPSAAVHEKPGQKLHSLLLRRGQ